VRRQLDELDRRDQALFEVHARQQSALEAAAEAEAREAEDLFVMQELELMVNGLPWAPDHPPCSGGIVGNVLQHVHGALPEDALNMSADLAGVFEVPAGEVPAGVPAGMPAGEVHRTVDDSDEVLEPSSRWTRRSFGAATSSNGQQQAVQRLQRLLVGADGNEHGPGSSGARCVG